MKLSWKTTNDSAENSFSLSSSINASHMSDRTQKI